MSQETTHAHHEHPDVVGSRNRLGVILIIVADVAMALSILFVYFYLKGQNVNNMWLPAATEEVPATVPVSSMGAFYIAKEGDPICLMISRRFESLTRIRRKKR